MTTTEAQTHKQFLASRRTGLGGSDAAPILGISPWTTAADVYLDKIGEAVPQEQTFAMSRGKRIESAILDEFSETHEVEVMRDAEMLHHPDHQFMLANIDGYFVDGNKRIGVEAKSTGSWVNRDDWGGEGTDEIPEYYLAQVHHYLAVTGWDRFYLAVWFGLDSKRDYVIERDQDIITGLIEAEQAFWTDHVLARVCPDPTNLADVKKLWPRAEEGRTMLLTPSIQYHAACSLGLKGEMKQLKTEIDKHEFAIFEAMTDCETILDPKTSAPFATRKNVVSKRLDTKRLRAEQPKIADEFTAISECRRFNITAAGKKTISAASEQAKVLANEVRED